MAGLRDSAPKPRSRPHLHTGPRETVLKGEGESELMAMGSLLSLLASSEALALGLTSRTLSTPNQTQPTGEGQ